MVNVEVTIKNESGLHARPATEFVDCAKSFKSKIKINRDGEDPVNAKSVIMLLSCGFCQGETVMIHADGEDEKEAADALVDIINGGFGEL